VIRILILFVASVFVGSAITQDPSLIQVYSIDEPTLVNGTVVITFRWHECRTIVPCNYIDLDSPYGKRDAVVKEAIRMAKKLVNLNHSSMEVVLEDKKITKIVFSISGVR